MTTGREKFRAKNKAVLESYIYKLNQIPKDVLYAAVSTAFTTAVELTEQDSGNAAWHWTITGLRAMERNDPRLDFSLKYGKAPIGQKGDKGSNRESVVADTLAHGLAILDKLVYVDGRKAVTIANMINPMGYRLNATPMHANQVTRGAHEAARRAAIQTIYAKSKGQ